MVIIKYINQGYEFLFETYLYHLTRKDNRHNFSVYFYFIYLNFDNIKPIMSILCMLPQLVLVVVSGAYFYKDLCFALFTQTFLFVTFNKVNFANLINRFALHNIIFGILLCYL